MLSDQDSSLKNTFSLEDSLKMLRGHVKSYVSESIKSTNSQPPDIHDFDLKSDVFYISLSGTTLNIMIFPVKSIFSQHFFFIFTCCHPKYKVPHNRMNFADFNLPKTLHSSILHNKSKIDKLEESNQAMKKQIGHMLSDQKFQYLMNLDYLFELLHTVKNNLLKIGLF
jgi:hypothetical protein